MEPTRGAQRRQARLYEKASANLVLLGAFFGLLWCLLHFTVNSTFARVTFDEAVNRRIQGRIGWERVTWGPLPWQVRVLEAALFDPRGERVASARELHAEVDLPALLDGHLFVDDIVIRGAEFRLVERPEPAPDGTPDTAYTIEQAFRPPVPMPDDGLPGRVLHLRFTVEAIEDATYVQAIPGAQMRVDGVEIRDARFELRDGGPGKPPLMEIGAERTTARRGTLDIGGPEVGTRRLGWTITDFAAHAFRWPSRALPGDGFDVERATFRIHGDPFEVRGYRLSLERPQLPWMRARVTARLADVGAHLEPLGVSGVRGPVELRAEAAGEADHLAGSFELSGPRLLARGVELGAWHVAGRARGSALTIDRLTLAAYGGQVEGDAGLDLESGDGHAWLRLREVAVAAAPLPIPVKVKLAVAGAVSGHVDVRLADLADPANHRVSGDVDLALERPEAAVGAGLPRHARLRAAATWAVAGGAATVTVHGLDLVHGHDHLEVRGRLTPADGRFDARGRVEIAELRGLLRRLDVPVEGRAQARFHAEGTAADPVVDADVSGHGIRYADLPPVDVEARVRYAGGRLALDPATVDGTAGRAVVRGGIGIARPGTPFDLKVSARRLDLEALPLDLDVGGRIDADVTVAGRADHPRVAGRARVVQPRWQRLAFRRIDAEGSWSGDAVRLKRLRLTDDQRDVVDLSGEIDLAGRRYRGRAAIRELPIDLVNRFLEAPLPVRGTLSADLSGEGTFDDPRGGGRIRLAGVGYDIYEGGEASLDVSAEGQMVTAQGQLFGVAHLDAGVPTAPGGPPARATFRFDGLALERHLPPVAGSGLRVRLSGTVDATADPFAGELGEIRARLGEVVLGMEGLEALTLRNDGEVRLSFRHGVLNLDRLRLIAGEQRLTASGTMGVGGDLDVRVVGALDLATLAPFLEQSFTHVEGHAALQLDVQGDVLGPYLDITPRGRLRIHRARLTPRSSLIGSELVLVEPVDLVIAPPEYVGFGPAMKPGTFEVRLAEERVVDAAGNTVANRLIIRRDDGELRISTFLLAFDEFVPARLYTALDASNARFNVPDTLRATIDARDLAVQITSLANPLQTRINVSGDVRIIQGVYLADHFSASELTGSVRQNLAAVSQRQQVSVAERVPLLQRIYLDLRVRGDSDIYVRNQVAVLELDLEIRPDLTVRGFPYPSQDLREEAKLTLEGTIGTVPGTSRIIYASRDFEVESGLVEFGRGSFLEGHLTASHTFRIPQGSGTSSTVDRLSGGTVGAYKEAEVILEATFRMGVRDLEPRYAITLRSPSGAYSQTDLFSLVTTGRLPSDLSGAASAQPALEVAVGPLLSLIERPLEESLNLDRVQLTPVSTGALVIEVDKALSRRLRLYSFTPVGEADGETARRFGLEYRINNFLFGDLTDERVGLVESTTGRLRLRLSLD